jgi:hypothetical protein
MLAAITLLAATHIAQPTAATDFTVGIELPSQVPMTTAVRNAIAEMGVQYVNYYIRPDRGTTEDRAIEVNAAMLDAIEGLDVDYAISCYVVDPPLEAVRAAAEHSDRFRGVVFDELPHCRLLNIHGDPDALADPATFSSLEDAYAKSLAGYQALHDKFAAVDAPVTATHVWPVLHHLAARAGFIVCPKIQKEFWSPVSMAIGLGAAVQYDRPLWINADLWYYDMVPGHPPEELWSNLLFAYWMGADGVYIEGAGYNLAPPGAQGIPFSLMSQVVPNRFLLTAHGEVLRRFIREYIPAHPRPYTFRDVRPHMAIVRFPDSNYGQRWLQPQDTDRLASWHPGLYGSPDLPSTPDSEAVFSLWNALTCGATSYDGLSHFKVYTSTGGYNRPPKPTEQVITLHARPQMADTHTFWTSMPGVVVYDHLVGYEHLKDVPILFITGQLVSDATREAVERCAEEGATVVVWKGLADRFGLPDPGRDIEVVERGEGRMIATSDFGLGKLWAILWPHELRTDRIQYRFGEYTTTFERVDPNRFTVEMGPTAEAAG